MWSLCALILGFCLDLIVGDPHWMPHPIVFIGKLVDLTEKGMRRIFPKTVRGENLAGAAIWLIVVTVSTGIPLLILHLAYGVSSFLGLALETVMCAQILATKSLKTESMKVYDALKTGDLEKARYAVSMIVGRDTQRLDEAGVARAAVETVAENASDGILAPLLWAAFLGPVGGMCYKAVNTMDSMVGYKNDRYRYFGRAAAMLDDVCNFLPARISGFLMCLAACLSFDGKAAFRIFFRDRKNHKSPNSAHTEAACAGALGLQLGGTHLYFGKPVEKPTIGDPVRNIERADVKRANNLALDTALLAMLIFDVIPLLIFH